MPSFLYERCLQTIMVVVYNGAKSWTCFENKFMIPLQARLIEGEWKEKREDLMGRGLSS